MLLTIEKSMLSYYIVLHYFRHCQREEAQKRCIEDVSKSKHTSYPVTKICRYTLRIVVHYPGRSLLISPDVVVDRVHIMYSFQMSVQTGLMAELSQTILVATCVRLL